MKSKAVATFVLLLFGVIALSHASQRSPSQSLPTSLDGKAYEIVSASGKPLLREVPTELPVLFYAGNSSNGIYRAYTTLSVYDEFAPNGRTAVTSKAMRSMNAPHLVPSGDLVVEDGSGGHWRVNDDLQFVVAAAWSPTDANALAFTFSSGSDYGVAVVDLRSKTTQVLRDTGILPDRVAWSTSGKAVQFYEEAGTVVRAESPGEEVARFALAKEDVPGAHNAREGWSPQLPRPETSKTTVTENQAFTIELSDGSQIKGDNLLGRTELQLFSPLDKSVQTVTADIIVGVSAAGLAYKQVSAAGSEIYFLDRHGRVTRLAASSSLVRYFLPFMPFASPGLTVTQSGSGYSPQCSVWDHTGTMAYAYDMQAKAGNEVIESAADGTVVYLMKSVTCNSLDKGTDGTKCADYSSTCTGSTSNSGWGNVVILQHADGTWTKYTHLKYGAVLPPSTGVSIAVGCEMAREGHTGATTGNKNGCGDHLHFQRQVSGALSGSSTSIAFADQATNPLRCISYTSGNQARSCLFR